MFKKIAQFTDLHIGKKNDSDVHNKDCMDYIDWFIDQAKTFGAETIVFCGDFHDVRVSINIKTLNHSVSILEKLSESFPKTYLVLGNHDLHYKSRLDIHSLKFAHHIDNIEVIDKPTTIDDVTFIPWLVDSNRIDLSTIKSRYVFSHLQMPYFFTNSQSTMSDEGHENADQFNGPEYVFSGHFHKRQFLTNKYGAQIIYTGSCFPHNYSDVNDLDHGCMLLEYGEEPIFVNWDDAPSYKSSVLSSVLENPENWLMNKASLKLTDDLGLAYDDINFIKETFLQTFNVREVLISSKKSSEFEHEYLDKDIQFKSVDDIVLSHIDSMDSEVFDKTLLSNIYSGL